MDDRTSIEWCMRHAQPGVWLDIGANSGLYTELFAGHALQVFAFEPSFVSYLHLLERCQGLPNVCALPYALWNTNTVLDLWLGREGLASEGNTVVRLKALSGQFGHQGQRISVPAVTADYFFSQIELTEPVTFVKIDVEGAEQQVLEGLQNLVLLHRPLICMEQHQMINCAAIEALLTRWGYTVTVDGHTQIPLTIEIPGQSYILRPPTSPV